MFSNFFIDRPIFAGVISIVILIAGLLALETLPIAEYPQMTPPTIQVSATYPGATAQQVEDSIATPLEQQVNGAQGMMYMSSSSTNTGQYSLTVTFALNRDPDLAQVDVQNRVSLAQAQLPSQVTQQGITIKQQSSNIVMMVALTSPGNTYDTTFLSNYALIHLVNNLTRLPGVSNVNVLSEHEYASVSYAVDFWGLYRRATEEAKDSLLATEQARRNVVIGVVSSVAQDYFQLRTLDLELQQTQDTVSAYRDSFNLTESLFKAGVQSELDVKQAQTALQTALAEVPALQQQIGQEEDALSVLLGQNPTAIPRGLGIAQQPMPPSVPAGLPSQLLERRPDVLEAANNLAAEYAAVGVAKAQFFPQLSLTGAGGTESSALSQIASGPALMWNVAGGLTQPLFTGGRLRGNLNVVKAQQQQALITYQSTALKAFQEVNDALIAYQRAQEQLAAQEVLVNAAKDALHLSNLRYQGGVDTYLNVLTAEESLFTGQITLAQDRDAVWAALVQLYQALGGGWQP